MAVADPTPDVSPTPTVIVNHLDIVYNVYGGGRRGIPFGQDPTPLRERLGRRTEPKVREIHAVKDVSFIAHHGESIGIIGRNGSGKSTLLRAVAGLIPPAGGRLWVSGEPSLLGVNAVLMNKLSGERNIQIGAQALGLSKAEIAERFDDIVEFSGIGDAVYLPMNTYSSGMSARLRFAISTAAAPDVLMIDEALATGDADFRAKSAARIAQIREEAGTVFLVSHSNSSIRQMCDRALWMDQGHLIMDGPTEEVVSAYEESLPKKSRRKKEEPLTDTEVPGTTRLVGSSHVQIAAGLTRRSWEPGPEGAFVVSAHRLAGARVIAPVAARLGWPLLWVRPGGIPAATHDEISRLQPKRVVVVGGEELISEAVFAKITEMCNGPVERLGDDDGAMTSAAVLRAFPPADTSTVYLTQAHSSGLNPSISLAAGVAGRAVIACDLATLSAELIEALTDLGPDRLLVGGDREDCPSEVLESLGSMLGASVEYLDATGPMQLAAGLWDDTQGGEVIITGWSPIELLTASVVAAHTGAVQLVFWAHFVPDLVQETLRRIRPDHIVLAGTMKDLNTDVRLTLGALVSGVESAPAPPP